MQTFENKLKVVFAFVFLLPFLSIPVCCTTVHHLDPTEIALPNSLQSPRVPEELL